MIVWWIHLTPNLGTLQTILWKILVVFNVICFWHGNLKYTNFWMEFGKSFLNFEGFKQKSGHRHSLNQLLFLCVKCCYYSVMCCHSTYLRSRIFHKFRKNNSNFVDYFNTSVAILKKKNALTHSDDIINYLNINVNQRLAKKNHR